MVSKTQLQIQHKREKEERGCYKAIHKSNNEITVENKNKKIAKDAILLQSCQVYNNFSHPWMHILLPTGFTALLIRERLAPLPSWIGPMICCYQQNVAKVTLCDSQGQAPLSPVGGTLSPLSEEARGSQLEHERPGRERSKQPARCLSPWRPATAPGASSCVSEPQRELPS